MSAITGKPALSLKITIALPSVTPLLISLFAEIVGTSFTAVTVALRVMALPLVLYGVVPPDFVVSLETSTKLPVVTVVELSTRRTVSTPGVPLKLAAPSGTKRSLSAAASNKALEVIRVASLAICAQAANKVPFQTAYSQ